MQKSYRIYHYTNLFKLFVVTVILISNLNFVNSSVTPKNDFTNDGLLTEWAPQDLVSSTGSGQWGISWNSTCIFIVYNNAAVTSWNGSVELVLVFDLNPKLNPALGLGSEYSPEISGSTHSYPFSSDLVFKISPGAAPVVATYFFDNTTQDWVNFTESLAAVQTSPGAAEIAIEYASSTILNTTDYNFKQFYFLGYAVTVTTVFDVTPVQGNEASDGSGNRTFSGYWGFMSIDGVEPSSQIHVNTFSTLPGHSSSYVSPPTSGNFNWSGYWWGLAPGVHPTLQTVVYIPENYTLHVDIAASVFALLNIGGNVLVETTEALNLAPGGLLANNDACCDSTQFNLKLLGSATFRNGHITDFFNVEAISGVVSFDEFSRIHGTLRIHNATIISPPSYQTDSVLRYSSGFDFARNQEWNSSVSAPKRVIIDGNTRLVLGTNGGQGENHVVEGDLLIFPGSTLDMNAVPIQSDVNVQGNLQNNGTVIFSSDLAGDLTVQGNYLHYGFLYRNFHDFYCPDISWSTFDTYCYQNNGSISVTATGGFPPISSHWYLANETYEDGALLQGLGEGNYNLTFVESNANGCPTTIFIIPISTIACSNSNNGDDDSGIEPGTIAIAIAVAVGGTMAVVGTVAFVSKLMNNRKYSKNENEIVGLPLEETNVLSISVMDIPGTYSSVRDVGVATEQNPKWRRSMEDEHLIIDKFGGEEKAGYFAVYDGHGGKEIAEFVACRLHKTILAELENCYQINSSASKHPTIAQAFKTAYLSTDELIRNEDTRAGSTAVTAYVRFNDQGERWLYVANCGDARAVLCRNGVASRLSLDHKPTEETEAVRIKNEGGWIVQGKVAGMLAVTRAFGDMELKKWVTADPYITETQLKETDTILVVACDGLWDVVDDQTCMDFVKALYQTDRANEIAEKLVKLAMEKGTRDNVSVIVVKL